MPMLFAYEAVGKSGRLVKGSAAAGSPELLRAHLDDQGLSLLDYRRDLVAELSQSFRSPLIQGSALVDVFGYLRGLAQMGMDVLTAWKSLEESIDDKKARVAIRTVRELISQGYTLADALERTEAFPRIVIGNVRAGEASGSLEKVYGALEDHYRAEAELKQQVYKATLYPLISIVVLFFIAVGLLAGVVPQLKDVFPADAPLPTKLLVFLSDNVVDWWWTPPLFGVAAFVLWNRAGEKTKAAIWEKAYRVPVIGPLMKQLDLCEVFFNLSMMLQAGTPLTTTLSTVIPSVGSRALREKLANVQDLTLKGGMFSDGFKDPFFPSVVGSALHQGETTGNLDLYLLRLARFLRDRARARLHTLATFIEPALLLVGGAMVMFLAVAIFLPIYGQIKKMGR